MVLTIDFLGDGAPLVWSLDESGPNNNWIGRRATNYHPTVYAIAARGMQQQDPDRNACIEDLGGLREDLQVHPAVENLRFEWMQPGFRFAEQPVLKIAVDRMDTVRNIADFIEDRGPPGRVSYRAFNVDFSPEFRFCLETETEPAPSRSLRQLRLDLPREAAVAKDLTPLKIDTSNGGDPGDRRDRYRWSTDTTDVEEVLHTLRRCLHEFDPDVLSIDRSEIIPLVADMADEHDIDLGLQRIPAGESRQNIPAYQQLAGESTFESYGRRMHSPARYNVPGRVVIDRSNTFFLGETNLAGALDLVERSGKPLQELSWASIGNVLTAIQIQEATRRDVLVQWRAWRPERFKTAGILHDADRGGTTLSPVVGVHEDVHELDFASMYPNIICQHNLSPETVRCRCHDRDDVPELGYSLCDRDGYLPEVLRPIIDDRAAIKDRLAGENLSDGQREALEGRSDALKWILVSCFGYQGFSNAKFGRIEVHEAINAYARDILLTAKEQLEAGGWNVLHGIVDSIWVTTRDGAEQRPLDEIATEISEEVGIALEYESAFDWVAFCPRRDGQGGALSRYFGKRRDAGDGDDPYKLRGIECRQRSTPTWIARVQQDLIEMFDDTRDPETVIAALNDHLEVLEAGEIPVRDLLVRTRASKSIDAYAHRTRTVAALERAEKLGLEYAPGEDIVFVVRNDDTNECDRVAIAPEIDDETRYDQRYYQKELIRAAASVLGPLGWTEDRIGGELDEQRDTSIKGWP